MWARYLLGFVLLLAACSTVKEPCASLACFKEKARQTYVKDCMRTFQDDAMDRPFLYIWPYDDPQWQWRYCIDRARSLIR